MLNKDSGLQPNSRRAANRAAGSVTDIHQPPAKVMPVRGPDAPPDPATGAPAIAIIGLSRSVGRDRDPDRHGRRRDRPTRVPTPPPAAIPAPAAPAPSGSPAPAC